MKISLKNVTKKFGQTLAVNDFSLSMPDGHLICLLGPSGCGKSTLLNMLCGIVNVSQGQIFFDDKDVTKLSPDKRDVGMVFQNYALYPHMTVLENIAFPLEIKKVPKALRLQKAKEIAELVHIDSFLKRYPGELSGGQQQRVAIARALIKEPKLLLMDEPLSNLDARLRLEMREEIRRIQLETGVTTIFVTHDQEEAMSISDSIILMKDGKLIQADISQELYENPNSQFVADFLGNPPINNFPNSKLNKNGILIKGKTIPISSQMNKKILEKFNNKLESINNITLSIRPESFIKDDKGIELTIERISLLGKEQIIYSKIQDSEVRIILNNDENYKLGDKIKLSLKNKGVFIFNSINGERLI